MMTQSLTHEMMTTNQWKSNQLATELRRLGQDWDACDWRLTLLLLATGPATRSADIVTWTNATDAPCCRRPLMLRMTKAVNVLDVVILVNWILGS